jgi:hypothetical protein
MLEKVINALTDIETQGSFTAKETATPENLHKTRQIKDRMNDTE